MIFKRNQKMLKHTIPRKTHVCFDKCREEERTVGEYSVEKLVHEFRVIYGKLLEQGKLRNFLESGCGNMEYFTCGAIVQGYYREGCHYRGCHCRKVLYKDVSRHGCHNGVMSLHDDVTRQRHYYRRT